MVLMDCIALKLKPGLRLGGLLLLLIRCSKVRCTSHQVQKRKFGCTWGKPSGRR